MDSTVPCVRPALKISSVHHASLVLRIAKIVIRVLQDPASAWFLKSRGRRVTVRMVYVTVMESVNVSLAGAQLGVEENVLGVGQVSIRPRVVVVKV